MWGQVAVVVCCAFVNRIIPTRVGTSRPLVVLLPFIQDHPHACGDKISLNISGVSSAGSSPRVWGQDLSPTCIVTPSRIIPTRVGTRAGQGVFLNEEQDHPHACGDKSFSVRRCNPFTGSSPRVWGQVSCLHNRSRSLRIIPTRVGTRKDTHSNMLPM